jgi:hypothetical protein
MIVNHWSDPYTIMMGVHTMDVVIQALCASGLVYMPFAIAIVVSIVEAMTQGADEGNAGELAVKFLRKKMFMIMPVFILAFIPLPGGTLTTTMKPLSTCNAPAISINNNATTTSMIGNFSGSTTAVPLWWAMVNDFSTTITNVTVASLPCAADLNAVITNINNATFINTEDQQVSQAWGDSCLSAAAVSLTKTKPYVRSWWPGHPDFLQVYAQEQSTFSIPTETAEAAGLTGITSGNSVRVNCLSGYQHLMDASRGIIKASGMTDEIKKLGEVQNMSEAEALSRWSASTFASVRNPFERDVYFMGATTLNNKTGGTLRTNSVDVTKNNEDSDIGIAAASFMQYMGNAMAVPDAIAYREATPIQTGIAEMVLLSVVPLLLVFSGFDLKVCLTLSGLYFGLEFTSTIAAFASWADSVITLITGDTSDTGAYMAQGVGLKLYTLLPTTWFYLLSFVGVVALPMQFTEIGGATANALKAATMIATAGKGAAAWGARAAAAA